MLQLSTRNPISDVAASAALPASGTSVSRSVHSLVVSSFRRAVSWAHSTPVLVLGMGVALSSMAHATTPAAHFSGSESRIGTGLSHPSGIAVDASGNVYVATLGGALYKETRTANGYTQTLVSSGMVNIVGIAVDTVGSVYLADFGGQKVWKVQWNGSGYNTPASLVNLSNSDPNYGPAGVAVDSTGNVYFTIWQNTHVDHRVMQVPWSSGGYGAPVVLSGLSGVAKPYGIAVDSNQNLFVADYGGSVVELPWTSGAWGIAAPVATTGISQPLGVAVDASDNVYIADSGTSTIIKETLSGGSYSASTIQASALSMPYAVAVDGSGNVYIADTGNNRVLKETLVGVNFGTVAIGTPSAAIPITFTFDQSATSVSAAVLTQGAPALDFAGTGTCTAAWFAAGATCTENVTFTPMVSGTRYGAVNLLDGSGNVLATGYVYGTGSGPQVNFLPGAESTLASTTIGPPGVAVDGSGNVYIVDYDHNTVLKETLSAGHYTASTLTTATPLNQPIGIAIDGGGNIYIADDANQRVLKETPTGSGYAETTIIGPAGSITYDPWGIAVDGSGNVYIADSLNNRVLKETLFAGRYTESTIARGLGGPFAVAVDAIGNVYIADTGNNRILKETPSAGIYSESILLSGLNAPSGIAVDGAGNLYIADYGNHRILKETLTSGGYTQSVVQTGALSGPYGLAVDASGNLYIADYDSARLLKEDYADGPSLSFAATNVGMTSADSPKTVTVENVGSGALTFPIPITGNNPSIAANFTLDNSSPSACQVLSPSSWTTVSLAAGADCDLSVSFTPTVGGTSFSGALVLTDDALNAGAPGYTTQSIALSGGAAAQATQTMSGIGGIPGSVVYGSGPYTLSATASSGLPVTFTVSGPATFPGPSTTCTGNSCSLTITGIGTLWITASQAGNAVFAPVSGTPYLVIVNPAPVNMSVSCWNAAFAYGSDYQCNVSLSSAAGTPLGAIGYALDGTAMPPLALNGGSASFTLTKPPAGSHAVVVSYGAQVNYAAARSQTKSFSVTPAAVNVTLTPSTYSAKANTAITFTAGVYTTSPGAPAPTGSVLFLDGGTPIGGPVVIVSGQATLASSSLTIGSHTITASYAGTANYASASASQTITVTGTSQTITFAALPSTVTFGSAGPYTISASATSHLPITFGVTGPATLSAATTSGYTTTATLTITGAGTVVVSAYQAGSSSSGYAPAPPVRQTITVNKAAQTIAFQQPTTPVIYGVSPITLVATGGASGNSVAFSVQSGPAVVSGTTLTITGAGTVVVAANQAGGANHLAAPQVTRTIIVNQAAQSINFPQPATFVTYPATTSIGAVGTASGIPVVFSVSGPAKLSGVTVAGTLTTATLTYTGGGTVVISANQAGNANYLSAPTVSWIITVNKGNQTITYTGATLPASVPFSNGLTYKLSATASSRLAVKFTATGPATITNNILTITGVGTVVVTASQAGNGSYSPVSLIVGTILVTQGTQTIAFSGLPATATYASGLNYQLAATASSGLPVTFSVTGPASISGSTLTVTGSGTVVVTASQAGNAKFSAATPVALTILVSQAATTMNVSCWNATIPWGVDYHCTVSVSSGVGTPKGSITYRLDGAPNPIVSVPLSSGSAQFTITKPGFGLHTVVIGYAGFGSFGPAASQTQSFTVKSAPVVVSLTPSTYSPMAGDSISFAVSVTSSSAGAPSSGLVLFSDSLTSSTLGSPNVDAGGHASLLLPNTVLPFSLSAGTHVITAIYSDPSGKFGTGSASQTITVAGRSQTITFTGLPTSVSYSTGLHYTLSASSTSGLAVAYRVAGPATLSGSTLTITGPGTVTVTASQPGNGTYNAAPSITRTIVVGQARSTTVLTAATTTPAKGATDILTATVTGVAPTGNVVFSSGGTTLYTATLNASGVATYSTYAPAVAGTVVIKAAYQGDTNNKASTGSLTLNVTGTTPVTLQLSSTNLVYPGIANVTACANSGKSAVATGSIDILDGATKLTTLTLGSNGCVTWRISPGLSAGTHSLTAFYHHDSNNPDGTSSPVVVTVAGAPVVMTVSCWNAVFSYGSNYQCNVHVSAGPSAPTGNITYDFDHGLGDALAGSVALGSGAAEFTIPKPIVGTHSVIVGYAAQGNFAGAPSQTMIFTVTGSPVVVQLTPSTYYAQAGSNISFTAQVKSSSAGAPVPVGTVTFSDSGSALPGTTTITLDGSGKATYATNVLLPGSHIITATYAPMPGVNYSPGAASQTITIAAKSQTITFTGLPTNVPYSAGLSYPLTATASSGLAVCYSVAGPATLSAPSCSVSNTLNISGVGTVVITATQPGDAQNAAADPVQLTISITKATQKITFPQPASPISYSPGLTIALTATANSTLPVAFTVASGPGSVSGSTLTVTGAGTIVVSANQAGNANFQAAPQVQRNIVVNQAAQTITFTSLPPTATYGGPPIQLTATGGSSGKPVTFRVEEGPATLSGQMLTITGTGKVVVEANQAGDTNYQAALPVHQTLVVSQAAQTITANFAAVLPAAPVTFGSPGTGPFTLSATSSSGLTVTTTVAGPASLSGNILTVTGPGTVTVMANQAGNSNYAAATSVTQSFTVNAATQMIGAISGLPASPLAFTPGLWYTLSATATSGLPVTFSVTGPGSLGGTWMSGTTTNLAISISGPGQVIVKANQAGNANYGPAAQVVSPAITFTGTQTITFNTPPSPVSYGASPITLTATGGASGQPITFSLAPGSPATLSGTWMSGQTTNATLTVTGAGTIVVSADQAGSAVYSAAAQVQRTVIVNPATVAMNVNCWNNSFVYGADYHCSVAVTSGAGLPAGGITYTYDGGGATPVLLASGSASFSISTPAAGGHWVVVAYPGSADFAAAPSQTRNFNVDPAPVNVWVTGPGTATAGASVTFTATVGVQSGSAPTPSGLVNFSVDGVAVPPAVALSGGVATFATSTLPVGAHTITAVYSGANYASGWSNTNITITP